MTLRERIRDWWRGYSAADVESIRKKMAAPKVPFGVIYVTHEEMKALNELDYGERYSARAHSDAYPGF